MDWNLCLQKYAAENKESTLLGSTYSSSTYEANSMVVPCENGLILLVYEASYNGRYGGASPCAMLNIELEQSYKLTIKKQNILKQAWEQVVNTYIQFADKEFMKKYAVRSNHPEYTKMALEELAWKQFMLEKKRLSIQVRPMEGNERVHTIKIYYNEPLVDNIFKESEEEMNAQSIEDMINCCNLTYWALSRYKIEDKEVDIDI